MVVASDGNGQGSELLWCGCVDDGVYATAEHGGMIETCSEGIGQTNRPIDQSTNIEEE